MDYRRDILPPLAGIGLSLVLHGALLYLNRDLLPFWQTEEFQTVVLELVPGTRGDDAQPAAQSAPETRREEPKRAAAAPPAPARPEPAREPPRTRQPPPPPPAPAPRQAALPQAPPEPPTPPAPAVPKTPEPPPDPVAVVKVAPPPQPPPSRQPAAPAEVLLQPTPRIADLMPTSQELARFVASERLPDPAQEGAREATLLLGEQDARYKGYLERVQAAIDISWRWKEAMLASGRSGTVLLQFSLDPGGNVENVTIEEGSGSPLLEAEAESAVRRARLPAFPDHWKIQRLHLRAQFDYTFE